MKAWNGVGEAYAASYASLCAGTIDVLLTAFGPAEGRTLLDVGSGAGDLVARAREAGWQAIGCEPEPSMLAVAAKRYPETSFVRGGLPELPFAAGSADAVTANFVLNHVKDPLHASRELARVARTGGALGSSIWVESTSWFWREVCERAGLDEPTSERPHPDDDFERTVDGLNDLLLRAGWRDVDTVEHSWVWSVAPQDLWEAVSGGVASAGVLYASLDADDRARFRSGFDSAVAAHRDQGAVRLRHSAAVAVGHAP